MQFKNVESMKWIYKNDQSSFWKLWEILLILVYYEIRIRKHLCYFLTTRLRASHAILLNLINWKNFRYVSIGMAFYDFIFVTTIAQVRWQLSVL